MIKLLAFDLDNTLAVSKSPIDTEMKKILETLIINYDLGIISGGNFPQIYNYVVQKIDSKYLNKLYILPTCGAKFYVYKNDKYEIWYTNDLDIAERETIIKTLKKVLKDLDFNIDRVYGSQIEDRITQIAFSALGQDAPQSEKENWDRDFSKRKVIKNELEKSLKGYNIVINGSTSIDINKLGHDKSYGMTKLLEYTGLRKENALFFGDSFHEGGNDFPVMKMGVKCIEVKNPEDTKNFLKELI